MMAAALELLYVLLVVLCGVAMSGCGRAEAQAERESRTEPVGKSRTEDPGKARLTRASEGSGMIEGVVRFTGKIIPSSTIVPVGTDPQYCGLEHSKEDYVVDPATRGVRYVIVRLKGKELRNWPHTKPQYLFLDNKSCRFEPHAAVLTVGSTIEVHNSDPILHTAHAYFAASFNFALVREGLSRKHVLDMPGLVQIRCDTHGWMNTFIRVDWHPFHAVTDVQGRFKIVDVPPGTYTLEAWHEQFGVQNSEVVVQDKQTAKVQLTYARR